MEATEIWSLIIALSIMGAIAILAASRKPAKRTTREPLDFMGWVPGDKLSITGLNFSAVKVVGPFFAYLEHEPDNEYDPHAVAVKLLDGQRVGYLRREDAADYAPVVDSQPGGRSFCVGMIKNEQDEEDGHVYRCGHVWAHAYLGNAHKA